MARNFILSKHAQERLGERSNLSAEEFLALLNAGAYKLGFAKLRHSLDEDTQKNLMISYGLTQKDLFTYKINTLEIQFEYLVVWSKIDGAPLTAVVSKDNDLVITVLIANQYETDIWKERITEKKIEQAKARADIFLLSQHPNNDYQIFIRWLDSNDKRKSKTISLIGTIGTNELEPSRRRIEDAVRKVCAGGYSIYVSIREKKNTLVSILEFEVDPIAH